MPPKRPHPSREHHSRGPPKLKAAAAAEPEVLPTGPYIQLFAGFRAELDAHHDRRERIIKASRDITAFSKKIIFSLQRLRPATLPISLPLPAFVKGDIDSYELKIQTLFRSVLPDLQGGNAYRYQRQISGGVQEYLEAVSFRHFLITGGVVSFEEAEGFVSGLKGKEVCGEGWVEPEEVKKKAEKEKENEGDVVMTDAVAAVADATIAVVEGVVAVVGDTTTAATAPAVEEEEKEEKKLEGIKLTREDYLLGLFDMTGEMMRFAITSVATTPLAEILAGLTLPGNAQPSGAEKEKEKEKEKGEEEGKKRPTSAIMLQGLRDLQVAFEALDFRGAGKFGGDVEKKMGVMRECVGKVEWAFYGLVVRGSERPEGVESAGGAGGGGGGDGGWDD